MTILDTKGKSKILWLLLLQIALLIYSFSGVFNKLASGQKFMSLPFIAFYICLIGVLGVYALLWQQVIKHMPLTTAYANKGITIFWGIVLGFCIFGEKVGIRQIVGAVIVIAGIVLYVFADQETQSTSPSDMVADK